MAEIRFHPDAREELGAAFDWYLEHSPSAGQSFLRQIDEAIARIVDNSQSWPMHVHGTHRFIVRVFPFQVVYRTDPEVIEIIAVAHDKRRPGYWGARVGAI